MRILLAATGDGAATLSDMLEQAHFDHEVVGTGIDVAERAKRRSYSMLLVTQQQPHIDCIAVLAQLREAQTQLPVMALLPEHLPPSVTAQMLYEGADDVVHASIASVELRARMHAIVRRHNGHAGTMVSTGGVAINLQTSVALQEDSHIKLSKRESQVLVLLALHLGQPVHLKLIEAYLRGQDCETRTRNASTIVSRLRRKLPLAPDGKLLITTDRDVGYTLRRA